MAEVTCPHCGNMLEAEQGEQGGVVECPHCGGAIELPADREDELDGDRIRRIAHARRSEVRAKAYCVIGGFALLGGSAQLIWMGVQAVQVGGWGTWAVGCIVVGALGVVFSIRLWIKNR